MTEQKRHVREGRRCKWAPAAPAAALCRRRHMFHCSGYRSEFGLLFAALAYRTHNTAPSHSITTLQDCRWNCGWKLSKWNIGYRGMTGHRYWLVLVELRSASLPLELCGCCTTMHCSTTTAGEPVAAWPMLRAQSWSHSREHCKANWLIMSRQKLTKKKRTNLDWLRRDLAFIWLRKKKNGRKCTHFEAQRKRKPLAVPVCNVILAVG